MRTLRTALAATLLTLALASVAEAQQPPGAGMGQRRAPTAVVDRWLEGITLTAGQTLAIDSVKQKFAPQMQALRSEMRAAMQDGGGDRAAMMKKNTDLEATLATEVRAVLTSEQHAAFDANREAAETQRRTMSNRGRPGSR